MNKNRFSIHSRQKSLGKLKVAVEKDSKGKEAMTINRINASSTLIDSDLDRATAIKKAKEYELTGVPIDILVSPAILKTTEDGQIVHFDFSTGEAYDPNQKIIGKITGGELINGTADDKRLRIITRFGRKSTSLNKKSLKFGPSQSNVHFNIPLKFSQASIFVAELRFLINNFSEDRINLLEGQAPGFSISIRKYQNKYYLHYSVATNEGWKSFSHYATPVSLNRWHEAAFIFKSGEISVILDGHLISQGIVPAKKLISVGNGGIYLGTWVDGRRNQFNGKVEFMRLWSKVPNHLINSYQTNQELDKLQSCGYKLDVNATIKTGEFIFPGESVPTRVRYRSLDGMVVLDGGNILGKESDLLAEINNSSAPASSSQDKPYDGIQTSRQALLAVSGTNKLWDNGIFYYQTSRLSSLLQNRLDEAIETLEKETNIRFVPASSYHKDVVIIKINNDAGNHKVSYSTGLGRAGGKQYIALYELATVSTIIHEIFHALGVMHEQCRNDRDTYIDIHWANMDFGENNEEEKSVKYQFEKFPNSRDMGPYDFNSIMHYHNTAFGKDDPSGNNKLITITTKSGAVISKINGYPYLSANDIQQINKLYPISTSFDGGHTWGSSAYTTGIAFGDINGDGADELLVARKHGSGPRFFFFNSEKGSQPYIELASGGDSWGSGAYATCIAAGDVDNDGIDEVIIGRKSSTNMRFEIRKYKHSSPEKSIQLFEGGKEWGDQYYTTGVAISKDRRGRILIGVCRRAGSNARFFIYGGATENFKLLFQGGGDWGKGNYATGIAFGDVDGDGYLEVGVTRYAKSGPRFLIYKAHNGNYKSFNVLHSGGMDWGDSYYATAIAFGDIDGDGKQEIGVTRKASSNARFFIYGNASQNFRLRHSGGKDWGGAYYANSIAMADVDNDGRDEILVGRYANSNARYFLYDDSRNDYELLADGGKNWGSDYYASAVALGNTRGGSFDPFIGIGRKAGSNGRFSIFKFKP